MRGAPRAREINEWRTRRSPLLALWVPLIPSPNNKLELTNINSVLSRLLRSGLHGDRALRKGHLVLGMVAVSGRVDDSGGDKDHQVLFLGRAGFAAEEPAYQRQVAQHRHLVFNLGHVFGDQAAQHDGLAVPNNHAGGHLSQPEVRQGKSGRAGKTLASGGDGRRDKLSGVIIAEELSD